MYLIAQSLSIHLDLGSNGCIHGEFGLFLLYEHTSGGCYMDMTCGLAAFNSICDFDWFPL